MSEIKFTSDFIWGASSAAYQIEGAWNIDGKSPSIWDTFTQTKGNVHNDENANITCDFYNNYKEDISLMKEAGLKSFRLSTAWSRILPDGIGKVNQKGLDFYNRVIDTLLEKNIEPFICLYHWDLPQILQDKGGWSNRESSDWFTEFTNIVVSNTCDRVKKFSTFNEPVVFTLAGYGQGIMAPGISDFTKTLQAIHHVNLSHGYSIKEMRSISSDLKCGCVNVMAPIKSNSNKEKDIEASRIANVFFNTLFTDPQYLGNYDPYIAQQMKDIIKDGDMKIIKQKLDYFGLNFYSHFHVQADPTDKLFMGAKTNNDAGFTLLPPPDDAEVNPMGWEIAPSSFYDQIMQVKEKYGSPVIYITENGVATEDVLSEKNTISDEERISFYKRYLTSLNRAINDGADVRGFYAWSFTDNFEWHRGYDMRFGMVYIDYENQKRIPKDSFFFYKNLIESSVIS